MSFSCIIESDLAGVIQMVEISAGDPVTAADEARRILRDHVEALEVRVFADGEEVVVISASDLVR